MSSSQVNFSLRDGVIHCGEGAKRLSVCVNCTVRNSVPNGKIANDRLLEWKRRLASEVQKARNGVEWCAGDHYAITLHFWFHPENHGRRLDARNQAFLDVENFVKPVLDGLAMGLFCDKEPDEIDRFNEDDSGFRTLLIHRHDDPDDPSDEGVRIFVSAIKQS